MPTDSQSQVAPHPLTIATTDASNNYYNVPQGEKLSGITVAGSRDEITLSVADINGQSLTALGLVLEFATTETTPTAAD